MSGVGSAPTPCTLHPTPYTLLQATLQEQVLGGSASDTLQARGLTNVVQQLEHLSTHESVARALREGELELHGMYFHVGEAQAYLLTGADGDGLFDHVEAAADLPA